MKRIVCFLASTLILLSSFTFAVNAEGEDGVIKYSSFNLQLFAAGIAVYDSNYGKATNTDDRYYEITVTDGCVTAVGGYNNSIPENSYVIAARGDKFKEKIASVKVGDYCIIDKSSSCIIILGDGYDPFYETTISFDKYNSTRTANTIVIYDKGETTNTNIWGNEVTVDADGFITVIGGNDSPIPEGGFVISAVGADRIAELNEAAELGLQVTVNNTDKTIKFAYSKESVKASVKIKLDDAKQQLKTAKENYLLIDYDAANERIEKLESIYAKVFEGIDDDNIPQAIASEYAFNDYYSTFCLLVNESPAVEGRAMWLRPAGLTTEEAVQKRVSEIKSMGFNIICLELFYDSTFICPMPQDGYFIQNPSLNGFDVLKAFISECAKQGVELQGWLPVYRVSYSTSVYYEQSLAAKKPEWLCLSKNGVDYVANEYGNGYFIDPSNKEACDYLLSVYEYLLSNYKLDGLQLDYIRYPHQTNEHFGYNQGTRDAFKEKYGTDPADIAPNGELWEEWIDFRCNYVTEFVKQIAELVNKNSPMTTLSCDIAPNLEESRRTHLQDAKKWLEEGIIDIGFPMAYGTNVVQMYSSYTVDACGDNGFAYIGLGDYGAEVFIQQILDSRNAGADGIAFFSYSQYASGGYNNKIVSTVLSKSAISPSYNCRVAAIAQINTILARIDLMKDSIEVSELEEYKEKLTSILTLLEEGTLTEAAKDIENACKNVPAVTDKSAEEMLLKDLKLLKKIALVNRDDYRTFINNDDIDTSDDSSDYKNGNETDPPVFICIGGISVLAVVGAIIVVVSRKKK